MKGFVPTPVPIVDDMVDRLFRDLKPSRESTVLDPGCGTGAFIEGILRWCESRQAPIPRIVGVESNPRHAAVALRKFASSRNVTIRAEDFLQTIPKRYDFVVANPPYVPITGLSDKEKADYRGRFEVAVERFDLYLLFFEQALKSLKASGRLVFITPEKFMYVSTAGPLRRLLAARGVEEIRLVDEGSFPELVTYPTITVVGQSRPDVLTKIMLRDGETVSVSLTRDGSSWLPLTSRKRFRACQHELQDFCRRISCGVATGADSVFVQETSSLVPDLRRFAFPTIAGRELDLARNVLHSRSSMLVPYLKSGKLMSEAQLGLLKNYLQRSDIRAQLIARTCVRHKPWYSFHENPPLSDILRQKILCKDVGAKPKFWIDWTGEIVPRHSVYYIVPQNSSALRKLNEYLNSKYAGEWLSANCQRAANGYLRLQSHVLKRLPIPFELSESMSSELPEDDQRGCATQNEVNVI
jgi:adenine-specific DNA-methyltransferase